MAAGFRPAESNAPRLRAQPRASTEKQRGDAVPLAYTQDFALSARAADGDARAEKQLAQRLIVRVRRAAHALMAGAAEADDAAQHALIELLRSVRAYPGETSLESWADRLAVRSLVRFARAVRTRDAAAGGVSPPTIFDSARPERFARTLEEFLRELPSAPREALLLREAFGFDLIETAQLMRSSTQVVSEQLWRARESLYLRNAKDADGLGEVLPEPVARWFALRDRSAADAVPPPVSTVSPAAGPARFDESHEALGPVEQEELRALDTQPELRMLQKELRALAQFIEGGRFGRPTQRDKKLLEGALAAARVSSISTSQALPSEAARDAATEPAEVSWVQLISLGTCVVMIVVAFVALALRPPEAPLRPAPLDLPTAAAAHAPTRAPTVEALSSAQAVDRGARLLRGGKPLEQGMSLREDDVVSAQTRAGCFGLSPRADVCLAGSSEVRIAQLGLHARRVELMQGRVVVSVERVEPAVPFALSVRELRIETSDGVLGSELDGDQVIVRVLRGSALIATPSGTHVLAAAQSAIYRKQTGELEIVPQLVEKARRDWDLLATRALGQPGERAATSARTDAPAEPAPAQEEDPLVEAEPATAPAETEPAEPALEPAVEPVVIAEPAESEPSAQGSAKAGTPEQLLETAKGLSRARRFAEAAALYHELLRTAPNSRSAREALVLRGELLSERLRKPEEALFYFARYLGTGGGLLEVRARYGRILALRHLGRSAEEQAASQEFLFSHGSTPQARALRARAEAATTGR